MRGTWPVTLSILSVSVLLACSTVDPTLGDESSSSNGESSSSTTQTSQTSLSEPTSTEASTLPETGPTTTASDDSTTVPITVSASDTGTADATATIGDDTTTTAGPGTSSGGPLDTSTGETGPGDTSTTEPPASCDDAQTNGDETDVDCGGSCGPCDQDQFCGVDADCASNVCSNETCAAPTCVDGKFNQDETDIDCGGATCPSCLEGDSCLADEDCLSSTCVDQICETPACDDNKLNQDETDIDCGGATCGPCADGDDCVLADDCLSSVCSGNVCLAASCVDGAQNQDETGIDCGGTTCAACQLMGLILNEVDYDQTGEDTSEFVEIYNNTGAPASLVGVHLVLVNGSTSTTYKVIDLSPAVLLAQGQYLVVAPASLAVPPEALKVNFANAKDNLQNGAPDGLALVDTVNSKLLDALSYEGSIANATVTGLGANINLVEGVAFPTADPEGKVASLARFPNGNDMNNAKTDWILSNTPTPGVANAK